jgi:hypothetical protein
MEQVNLTIITLVPKKDHPSKIGDFQLYLVVTSFINLFISKILANGLIKGPDGIISSHQNMASFFFLIWGIYKGILH